MRASKNKEKILLHNQSKNTTQITRTEELLALVSFSEFGIHAFKISEKTTVAMPFTKLRG